MNCFLISYQRLNFKKSYIPILKYCNIIKYWSKDGMIDSMLLYLMIHFTYLYQWLYLCQMYGFKKKKQHWLIQGINPRAATLQAGTEPLGNTL